MLTLNLTRKDTLQRAIIGQVRTTRVGCWWIHWDFNLKAASEDVYVSGTYREIHFMLSEKLTDDNWREFIFRVKSDYSRVGGWPTLNFQNFGGCPVQAFAWAGSLIGQFEVPARATV